MDPGSVRPAAYSAVSKTVTMLTSCTVCDPVGSSSRMAIRRPDATLPALIRSRAPGTRRIGGAAPSTCAAVGVPVTVVFVVI